LTEATDATADDHVSFTAEPMERWHHVSSTAQSGDDRT